MCWSNIHLRNLLTHTLLFWHFLEHLNFKLKITLKYIRTMLSSDACSSEHLRYWCLSRKLQKTKVAKFALFSSKLYGTQNWNLSMYSVSEVSLYFIFHKIWKLIQDLSSTSIKLYIHYAHTNNNIILDNLIAYVLEWVWTRFKQDDLGNTFILIAYNRALLMVLAVWTFWFRLS